MPLFPPPESVEHPADLVVDVFGTFLGKRSERLVIRWRNFQDSQQQVVAATNDADKSDGSHITEPVSNDSSQSESESLTIQDDKLIPPAIDDASDGAEVALAESLAEAEPECSGADSDSSPPANPDQHLADEAAARLLAIWARQSAASEVRLPTPVARLQNQVEEIAGFVSERRVTGPWQERAVPMSRLRSVTIAGRGITVSSDLIEALVERGIGLSFLSGRGQPVAQLSAPGLSGTVQTRRSQLAAYETALGVDLAVEFIRGKLRNQKHQLQYSGKYLKASDPVRFERLLRKIKAMGALRKQLLDFQAASLDLVRDKLMGYEGTGARIYWEGVAILLEGRVEFPGRSTRGALDPVNSSLNYGYGILYSQVAAAISNAGLELYAGFLHVDRPGKPALVLDLVEEFRAPIVDRSVLAIVNQGISLETDEHGLKSATRKLVAHRILERLSTAVPYEGKRWTLGTIIQNQARHLAVAVRGERKYRAFASRW